MLINVLIIKVYVLQYFNIKWKCKIIGVQYLINDIINYNLSYEFQKLKKRIKIYLIFI